MNVNNDDSRLVKANRQSKIKSKWKKRQERIQNARQEHEEMDGVASTLLELDPASITKFSDLPLSRRTQQGLKNSGYVTPTEIQRLGIPAALRGCDILGAAETGSGKTLAFLIPVLEGLWKLKWSAIDGLGALVISPTRELAYQTFEVLRKIGKHHDISAGLIIGGKDVSFEQQRIQKTNIIVCTPGRLLQHMDETPHFDCSTLKILVLDEADRILDLGFSEAVNAIIENLPEDRQTLLYSATQTSSVSDLARLSLHEPEFVSVYKESEASTPQELKQSYVVCELQNKVNFMYSFIKHHLKSKILVFLSSCKQVKFIFEAFRRLRPGVPLMALHGKQNQVKRVAIYNDFCKKTAAVLFATDIAARGLDFPAVHWVVQLDCPEDANTYIHRAGRTARYQRGGHSLLILLPSEVQAMLQELEIKKIPITEIKANPKKLNNIQRKLESLCVQDQNIKQWAQKSVVSYVRSVYLQSNKKIFNVDQLAVDKYSLSLGLLTAPRVRFLQKAQKNRGSNVDPQDHGQHEPLLEANGNPEPDNEISDSFLVLRKRNLGEEISNDDIEVEIERNSGAKLKSKVSSAKRVLKKKINVNTKVLFDDEGKPIPATLEKAEDKCQLSYLQPEAVENGVGLGESGVLDLKQSSLKLVKQDKHDKRDFQNKVKEKHREKRRKEKQKRNRVKGVDEERAVTLQNSDKEDKASEDSEGEASSRLPSKRARHEREAEANEINRGTLEDDEELALKLLGD